MDQIRLSIFKDVTDFVLKIGDKQRLFRDAGLSLEIHSVKNADEAHRNLQDASFDLVFMSFDDLLACAHIAHGDPKMSEPLTISAVHRGFLSFIARPGLTNATDLQRKRVGIDTRTGYAAAWFKYLEDNQLDPDNDVEFILSGATDLRFEKLQRHEIDASLLNFPFDRMLLYEGFERVGTVAQSIGPYEGVCVQTTRDWFDRNENLADRFLCGFRRAIGFVCNEDNKDIVVGGFRDILGVTDTDLAGRLYNDLIGRSDGLAPDGRFSRAGIETVCALNRRFSDKPFQGEPYTLIHPGALAD